MIFEIVTFTEMSFLNPTFLWALFALSIPIIIHLFNFRRYKKIYFSNVQFLKDIKQESDSKSKLKEWLILFFRLLALTALILAFAQPYVISSQKIKIGQKAISIYIDNSFSMEQTNAKGTLLENAKNSAIELVNTFDINDKFQILTNDFEAKHQRLMNKEEALEAIIEIKPSSASRKTTSVLNKQNDFLKDTKLEHKQAFVISDFQKNSTDIKSVKFDSAMRYTLIPVAANQTNNIYIDSLWFDSPIIQINTPIGLNIRIQNKSNQDVENSNVSVLVNNKQVSITSFNSKSFETTIVKTTFKVSEKLEYQAVVKIQDYPISFDDQFYFSFKAQEPINLLVINGKETLTGDYFKSLFGKDSLYVYNESKETTIDFSIFPKSSLIILNELTTLSNGLMSEIQKHLEAGGTIAVIPYSEMNIANYNEGFSIIGLPEFVKKDTARTKTQSINFEQGFYQSVFETEDNRIDLPIAFEHFNWNTNTKSNEQKILNLANNTSFLSYFPSIKGKVYLFSVPFNLKSTNFIKHALFVPTFIRIALLSVKPKMLYYKTASNEAVFIDYLINTKEKPLHIKNSDNSIDIIPEARVINNQNYLFTQNQIQEAGHYLVTLDKELINGIAFNYNRLESEMAFLSIDNLNQIVDEIGNDKLTIIENPDAVGKSITSQYSDGQKLWKLFLILALVFLMSEILIIRLFKN